jgi:hypothetical protein
MNRRAGSGRAVPGEILGHYFCEPIPVRRVGSIGELSHQILVGVEFATR